MSCFPLQTSNTPLTRTCCSILRSKASKNSILDSSLISGMNNTRKESSVPLARPMPEIVQTATIEELREMVSKMWNENLKLEAIAGEARMSAAHYKLHYNLLSIESQEALNRMEVENYMFRREAAIMRQNPLDPTQLEYNMKLKEYCKYLKKDHIEGQRRLKKARQIIKIQDKRLVRAQQVISLLQERIRENRKHVTEMRHACDTFHHSLTSINQPEVSQVHHYSSPRSNSTPNTSNSLCKHPESTNDHREKFNALLLAGSILNQENKNHSSLATPQTHLPHTRQYLNQDFPSSFRAKNYGQSCISNTALLPPVQFTPEVEARITLRSVTQSQSRTRRRSRDSTISASDAEEIGSYQTSSNSGKTKDPPCVDESNLYALRATFGNPIGYKNGGNTAPPKVTSNQDENSIISSRIIAAVQKRKREEEITTWENERKKGKRQERVELEIGC